MYISLYRKYRPAAFSDMVGQGAAIGVLSESLKEGRVGHAYLFSGPRGCGKTSAARLLAKSLNCPDKTGGYESCGVCSSCLAVASGEHLDVIEIDGASNRGIGEIRDLKTHVNLRPLSAPYKIYIIDEVHMLTEAAFNALLKTLEEPPSSVVFILATTEPHKVPVTIRSRCQHIPFHRISMTDMALRIKAICDAENISFEEEAVRELARQADGALRDALSLMEQTISLGAGSLTLQSVRDLTGGSNRTELEKWVTDIRTEPACAAENLHSMLMRGMSPERFCESLFSLFKDLWIYRLWGAKCASGLEISEDGLEYLKRESAYWAQEKLKDVCIFCNSLMPRARYGMRVDVFAGLILMNLTQEAQSSAVFTNERQNTVHKKENPVTLQKDLQTQISATKPQAVLPKAGDISTAIDAKFTQKSSFASKTDWNTLSIDANKLHEIIQALPSKQLLIASALLSAKITLSGSTVGVVYEADCPAKIVMSIPENMQILKKAVCKVWNIEENESTDLDKEKSIVKSDIPVKEESSKQGEQAPKTGEAQDNTEKILRLIGADVLYVREASLEDEVQEDGE